MKKRFFAALSILGLTMGALPAQTPAPVLIQAVTPAPAAPAALAAQTAAAAASAEGQNPLPLLQEMKAANAETIKKQQAALETLDLLQKAADEIKIFSKRG